MKRPFSGILPARRCLKWLAQTHKLAFSFIPRGKFRVCYSGLSPCKLFRPLSMKALCSSLRNIPSECSCSINKAKLMTPHCSHKAKNKTQNLLCVHRGETPENCFANSRLRDSNRCVASLSWTQCIGKGFAVANQVCYANLTPLVVSCQRGDVWND